MTGEIVLMLRTKPGSVGFPAGSSQLSEGINVGSNRMCVVADERIRSISYVKVCW
jgi:hypothetical protein